MSAGEAVAAALSGAAGSIARSEFRPLWWLRNRHLQTIWPALLRRAPRVDYRRERITLADGDWLELAWGPERPGPLVVLLHGLGSSAESRYIRGLVRALAGAGFGSVVMQFRCATGIPNERDRFFHAADIGDFDHTLTLLRERFPGRSLAAVGVSLGGSILLNWLAARGDDPRLQAACAVSVPFDLAACADALDRGFARLYQRDLLRSLRRVVRLKFAHRSDPPFDLALLPQQRTLRAFDDLVVAPLHGFAGAADYYARASCRPLLARIARPTLILHAADDPFVPPDCLPRPAELSPRVTLELADAGGHVGFVAHDGRYWLEHRIPHYLAQTLGV